jgi:drug/metabolite transporter (DMT)-like permease
LTKTNEWQNAGPGEEVQSNVSTLKKPNIPLGTFTINDFLLLVCILIWALNSPFVKIALEEIAPLAVSQLRVTLAAVVSLAILVFRERSFYIAWRHLPLVCLAALMGITTNQITFIYALSNTSASAISLLYAASPLFSTLLAALIFGERVKRSYFFGLPLALVGVVMIILTAPNASLDGNVLGNLLAVVMAFSWAAYTVLLQPLLKYYSPLRLSACCFAIGSLFLIPFSFSQVLTLGDKPISLVAWLILGFSAILAMVLTNVIWYSGVKKLGVSRTVYYTYLQPFFGVIAAAILLSELIVPWQILGGMLVIGSLLIYRLTK